MPWRSANSAAAARLCTPILASTCATCALTVFGLRKSRSAICGVREPGGHQAQHLHLARRQPRGRAIGRGVEAGGEARDLCEGGRGVHRQAECRGPRRAARVPGRCALVFMKSSAWAMRVRARS